jgi:hypothetical protein
METRVSTFWGVGMKKIVVALAPAAFCLAGPAFAETPTTGPAPLAASAYVVAAPVARVTLPANSMVVLEATDQASSGALRVGAKINLSVVYDVKVGDTVVIPAGTRAEAEVSWRTGRGAFGKSGKIEFDLKRLYVGDRATALSGHYRVEGNGAPWAAAATIVVAGWPGIFVTGHSARIEPGHQFIAYTSEPLAIAVAPKSAMQRTARGPAPAHGGVVQVYEGRKAGHDDAILVPM